MHSSDSMKAYAYGMSKDLVSKKKIKCKNIIKRHKND